MNEYLDILLSKKPIRTIKIIKDSYIDEDNVNDSDYFEIFYIQSELVSIAMQTMKKVF
ncbi:hypothetical protein A3Q56_05633 [Intoshia linei]|uniref:Uncharacterized protein n=1 Tax=Intoshia linei TaxID=1819745 RepID=A0A177AZN1_9BILA|nr:hypothetical protein A3Q56_05633 [Intoshia linei]